jgi:hypothetical protein
LTLKVAALIVAAFMGSLNVAEMTVLTRTAVAPFGGTVDTTAGAPVVKLHAKLAASALPPGSLAPVVIVAEYKVLEARGVVGVKVAVVPARPAVPATAAPPGPVRVKVVVLIVAGAMTELNVAVTVVLGTTFTAPLAGVTDRTRGGSGLCVCSRPQPERKLLSRKAMQRPRDHILLALYSFICAPSSFGDMTFPSLQSGRAAN